MLLGGRIFTADPARPWADALAVRGDRVVAVGDRESVGASADRHTRRLDLGGRTVVPGLNDAHVDDPGLGGERLAALGREALAAGVTSMQWFVGTRTAGEAARDLVAAGLPVRTRVLRMPRPGPGGATVDSRPHLPPQPSRRVDVRGMGFLMRDDDRARLSRAVGWAYGSEDLLAVEPATDAVLAAYVEAIASRGLPEVWARKRPRVEQAGPGARALAARLASLGVVVVQRPGQDDAPLRSLLSARVPLALGTGDLRPFDALAWAIAPARGAEALSRVEAVEAFTRGSAWAEGQERDKGHLSVGALADLAVLSDDVFAVPAGRVSAVRSVLTMVGGVVVHDAGVVR